MHWLFLLLSLAALGVAITTTKVWLLGLALVAALGFFVAWALGWYRERMGGGDDRNQMITMVDPAELRRLRELAEARKRDAALATGNARPGEGAAPPSA